MAKILTEEVLKALKKFDLPKGYQRTGEFPLDPSSVFASKADADLYASGGADSRGLSGTRYAGQLIAVVENGVSSLYTVEGNDTLKAVGGDVSADLATLTGKVEALLAGDHTGIDSLADVKAKFDSLKDLVVESGVVRVPTEEEIAADKTLVANDLYIVLTIKNSNEKLYIPAKALVDVYVGSDYVEVSDTNVISLKVADLEAKLVADEFTKKSNITDITATLATQEALNAVKETADAASAKADANEGSIGTLSGIVGNSESGLVKDVADIKADLTGYKVKDVDTTISKGVGLTLTDGKVGISVDPTVLAPQIQANLALTDANVTTSAKIGSTEAGAKLSDVLQNLDSRITSAVSGGLTAVAGSDAIKVSDVAGNSQTIELKIAGPTTNNLVVTTEGLDLVWLE